MSSHGRPSRPRPQNPWFEAWINPDGCEGRRVWLPRRLGTSNERARHVSERRCRPRWAPPHPPSSSKLPLHVSPKEKRPTWMLMNPPNPIISPFTRVCSLPPQEGSVWMREPPSVSTHQLAGMPRTREAIAAWRPRCSCFRFDSNQTPGCRILLCRVKH